MTVDCSAGKIGAKIRNAQVDKIPYMLVAGPREAAAGQVSVRSRAAGDEGACPLAAFREKLARESAAPEY